MDHLDNPARRRETQPSAEHQQIATDSERQRQLACVPNDPVTDVPVATSSAVPAGLDQFTPPVCVVLFYVVLGVPSLFVGSSIRETVPGP